MGDWTGRGGPGCGNTYAITLSEDHKHKYAHSEDQLVAAIGDFKIKKKKLWTARQGVEYPGGAVRLLLVIAATSISSIFLGSWRAPVPRGHATQDDQSDAATKVAQYSPYLAIFLCNCINISVSLWSSCWIGKSSPKCMCVLYVRHWRPIRSAIQLYRQLTVLWNSST